jgi:hypothetical protein
MQYGSGATSKYIGLTEVFHVYSGLTTLISGGTVTPADYQETVTEFDLTGKVTAPAAWAAPVTSFTETDQYLGTGNGGYGNPVQWQTEDGSAVSGVFAGGTVYKAVVNLVPRSGLIFTGVPADSFTYSGAYSVTNAEDSGAVTITFPATDSSYSITDVTVTPGTLTVDQGRTQTFTVTVAGTPVTPPQTVTWSVSGNNSAGTSISAAGVLTVATNETGSLTVTATSTVDTSQSGTATVTVNPVVYTEIYALTEINDMGGKYRLMQNLTLTNWTPKGTNTAPFTGIFDGNGKTITVESFASSATLKGIFGCVIGTSADSRAVLKDLEIVASSVSNTSGVAAGLLAAYAKDAEISGITLSGSFSHAASEYVAVGGIVGYFAGGVLEDCTGSLAMTVSSTKDATGASTLFTGTTVSASNSYAGGFAGYAYSANPDIIACSNTGSVTGTAARNIYSGGITGYIYSTSSGQVTGCSSAGNISAAITGTGNYGGKAGGIAGYAFKTSITGCRAEGTVSAAGKSAVYAGGIAGQAGAGGPIAQSYFNGAVEVSGTGTNVNSSAGGIAGASLTSTGGLLLEDCWSHGQVTGVLSAGGIIGCINNVAGSIITRCYSTAAVACTSEDTAESVSKGMGGIAGINAVKNADGITGCVALNSGLSSAGVVIHRVLGVFGTGAQGINNNYAWSGMTVTPGSGTYTPDESADKPDGAGKTATELNQAFYEGLGWDFGDTWAMDSNGYPKLQWQTEEISRSPLT